MRFTIYVRLCIRDAGYQPTKPGTPTELIGKIQMKENLDTQTDPILEECYRMKEEFAAKFKTQKELYNYLQAEIGKTQKRGVEIYHPPRSNSSQEELTRVGSSINRKRIQLANLCISIGPKLFTVM